MEIRELLLNCKNCNTKNDVLEISEPEDIENFTDRILVIGVCKNCGKDIAMLVETRKTDSKVFCEKYCGVEAQKVIKRENKRIKNRVIETGGKFFGWVFGHNVGIKNKNGKIVKIRQYGVCLKTNRKKLVKVLKNND